MQNAMLMMRNRSNSKPELEFQYGERPFSHFGNVLRNDNIFCDDNDKTASCILNAVYEGALSSAYPDKEVNKLGLIHLSITFYYSNY